MNNVVIATAISFCMVNLPHNEDHNFPCHYIGNWLTNVYRYIFVGFQCVEMTANKFRCVLGQYVMCIHFLATLRNVLICMHDANIVPSLEYFIGSIGEKHYASTHSSSCSFPLASVYFTWPDIKHAHLVLITQHRTLVKINTTSLSN